MLDKEIIYENLAEIDADNKEEILRLALSELIYALLFQIKTEIGEEDEKKLSKLISSFMEPLT